MISRLLFHAARSRLLHAAVRFGFAHLSPLLPVRRVCETERVIVFRHPRPAWRNHILVVPKASIPTLLGVRDDQLPLVRELIQVAVQAALGLGLDRNGFAILVNGGRYQDVGQLHFHLASGTDAARYDCPDLIREGTLLDTASAAAFRHRRPRRATHLVIRPIAAVPDIAAVPSSDGAWIDAVIVAAQELVRRLGRDESGYTLVASLNPVQSRALCFHLVSGEKVDRP